MSTINIPNAASRLVNLGVQDLSTAQIPTEPEAIPQHLPKSFIFAQRGPVDEQLVVGGSRVNLYGEETFAENSVYFNHATLLSNIINATGNSQMHVRVVPKDAGPKPTIVVWMDVLPTTVDDYKRNADGSLLLDQQGQPTVIGSIAGFKVKFVLTHYPDAASAEGFGASDPVEGDQVDNTSGVRSTRYPIFELEHSFFGGDGNNSGIRLWAMTTDNTPSMPVKLMNKERVYPYGFAVIRKNASTGSAKPVSTVFTEQNITISFKEGVVDPTSVMELTAGKRMVEDYQNLVDPRYAIQYGEFGRVKVYTDNIETLLAQFQAAEVPYLAAWHDFTADSADKHLYNFISGTASNGAPYRSLIFTNMTGSIRFSPSANIYANGGSDGTMNDAVFADLVSEYMQRYADINDEIQDIAYHVESCVWDSGFPLATKYELLKMIAIRKDTFTFLSPYEVGNPTQSPAEEASVAASLLARASLYPDSTYFNTPVFRAFIQGNSGKVRNSKYTARVPMNMDLCQKLATFMGAANGAWVTGKDFVGDPGNIVSNMYDIAIRYVSPDVANRFWDVSLNWVSRADRERFYYPQFKTVYDDDTSVLTSLKMAFAIIKMNKVLAGVHRRFTGRDDLTNAQFSKAVNDAITAEAKGLFNGQYIIVPNAQFTSMDERRNYSWTVPCDIYGPGMKTVMTTYLVARRIEDFKG